MNHLLKSLLQALAPVADPARVVSLVVGDLLGFSLGLLSVAENIRESQAHRAHEYAVWL